MPREIHPIFKRKNNSRPFSNPSQRTHGVKPTKFLLLVVPHPLESPSAAAMVRRRKTLLRPSRSRNYSLLPSPKSTPSPVRSLPVLEMRAKLGTPPPPDDSPCPAPKSHCHRTEPFHNPKRIPTRKLRQFEPGRHTPLACRCKTTSQGPRHQAPQGLLFSSTPLPGKPRSLFFSKDARRRFGWGV